MESEIKELQDKEVAVEVGEFLTGSDAFDQTWAPKEMAMVKKIST